MIRKTTKKMIVYKKVYNDNGLGTVIATLEIPKGAVCNMTSDKCRASRAKVIALNEYRTQYVGMKFRGCTYNVLFLGYSGKSARSGWDRRFRYKVGETVKPQKRFSRSNEVCASGIHFFKTKIKAANY